MRDRGHEVVTVGRSSGDTHCDIADDTQLAQLWEQAGQVDAVVYTTLDELSSEDLESSLRQKALAQINLVRTGLEHVSTTGSFTLISGIPLHDPVVSGTAAAAANGVIKAFVRAAAVEIAPPPRRINEVSPSVVEESLDAFGDFFPGFAPVPVAEVAGGFQKAIEGAGTGRTIELP